MLNEEKLKKLLIDRLTEMFGLQYISRIVDTINDCLSECKEDE